MDRLNTGDLAQVSVRGRDSGCREAGGLLSAIARFGDLEISLGSSPFFTPKQPSKHLSQGLGIRLKPGNKKLMKSMSRMSRLVVTGSMGQLFMGQIV